VLAVLAGPLVTTLAQDCLAKPQEEILLSSDATLEDIQRAIKQFEGLKGLPEFH
jgi:hypothetical protein